MTDKTVIFTDGGSVNKRGKWYGGWGFSGKTGESATFIGYGACKSERATNNVAELDGYINAAKYVIKNDIKNVTFTLDSKYVLNGATKFLDRWENNNWLTSTGSPVVNKDKWLEVKEIKLGMDAKDIVHKYAWVKGHSGVDGNEAADKGATKGIKLSFAQDFEPVFIEEFSELGEEIRKVKPDYPKLLCLKRMPVVTNMPIYKREESDHFIYYQTTYDDKGGVRAKYLGRPGTDVLESVVLSKKEIKPLTLVMEALNEAVGESHKPAIINWDKISSKKNYGAIIVKEKGALTVEDKEVYLGGEELLAYRIGSPRMAFHTYRSLDDKYLLLDSYLNGKLPEENILDLTDLFFVENEKGKQKPKPGISALPSFKVTIPNDNGLAEFLILPNINIPQVTRLTSTSKTQDGLTIKAVIHGVGKRTYKYSFILETGDGDIAVFDSPHSNLRTFKIA